MPTVRNLTIKDILGHVLAKASNVRWYEWQITVSTEVSDDYRTFHPVQVQVVLWSTEHRKTKQNGTVRVA